jgi:hypothetical protein
LLKVSEVKVSARTTLSAKGRGLAEVPDTFVSGDVECLLVPKETATGIVSPLDALTVPLPL